MEGATDPMFKSSDSTLEAGAHITIKDIAKLAGVSTATVSRVMNGSGSVSPQTRVAVMKTISTLNYRPNSYAILLGQANGGIPRSRNDRFRRSAG
jgi:transcriptional regulator with XRE-family HTH domain